MIGRAGEIPPTNAPIGTCQDVRAVTDPRCRRRVAAVGVQHLRRCGEVLLTGTNAGLCSDVNGGSEVNGVTL